MEGTQHAPDRQRAEDTAEQSINSKTNSTDRWTYQLHIDEYKVYCGSKLMWVNIDSESLAEFICDALNALNALSVYQSATGESLTDFLKDTEDIVVMCMPVGVDLDDEQLQTVVRFVQSQCKEYARLARAADRNEIENLNGDMAVLKNDHDVYKKQATAQSDRIRELEEALDATIETVYGTLENMCQSQIDDIIKQRTINISLLNPPA